MQTHTAIVNRAADRRTVVGLLSRLRSPRGQSDPFPIYTELRALGDVLPAPWGGFLLTGYDTCDQVLRSPTWTALDVQWRSEQANGTRWESPAAQELAHTILALNPPDHTRQRRSLSGVLDRTRLESMAPVIRDTVDRLLDTFQEAARDEDGADFAELVGEQLPVQTIGHLLSLPESDFPLLLDLTHKQAHAQELLPTARQIAEADKGAAGLREYFTALVAERRRRPGNDVVSHWLRVWDDLEADRDLVDETVYSLTMFLAIASMETTSTVLSTATWTLLNHPDQWRAVVNQPDLVPQAVEEVLRYDPPVHVTSRVAGADTELSGVPIARGHLVHTLIGSANHDPAATEHPDRFDITRRGRHISFGGGIHYCVGSGLARMETGALLHALRERPTLHVATPPTWEPRLAFRRMTGLRLACSARTAVHLV